MKTRCSRERSSSHSRCVRPLKAETNRSTRTATDGTQPCRFSSVIDPFAHRDRNVGGRPGGGVVHFAEVGSQGVPAVRPPVGARSSRVSPPPGSACSIILGREVTPVAPGSTRGGRSARNRCPAALRWHDRHTPLRQDGLLRPANRMSPAPRRPYNHRGRPISYRTEVCV